MVARTAWLATATNTLGGIDYVLGVWVVGSIARSEADAFSDVDLVVAVDHTTPTSVFDDPVGGLRLPGTVLYQRPKPRNAPAGGAYLAVAVELAGMPVLVDIYLWPAATAAVPDDAQILYERHRLPRTDVAFMPLLNRHRSDDSAGSDPADPATTLMLAQLAAKYLARGDQQKLVGISARLAISGRCSVATLRAIITQAAETVAQQRFSPAVRAIGRLLDGVEQNTRKLG